MPYIYCNKAIELINIPSIFNNDSVKPTLKDNNLHFAIPTVVYNNLANPVYSKMFNFNFFVSSIDTDKFIADPDSFPCNCAGCPFIEKSMDNFDR